MMTPTGPRPDDFIEWLRRQLTASGARGVVVGLSGGSDSAVVARLCQLAAADRCAVLIMPCESVAADTADALLVARHFEMPATVIDLAPAYHRLAADLTAALGTSAAAAAARPDAAATAAALLNLKARLRMSTLYFTANARGYLVAGTSNRTELLVGYFTKHGDGASDLLPIGGLLKGEVRMLARELGVPAAIIDKAPSAGLHPGQTDEADLGVKYADLDRYAVGGPDSVPPALAMRIERMIRASEHKRARPATPGDDD